MSVDDFWDEMLLPLADAYESGDGRSETDLGLLFPEVFAIVRQCLATKVAEGSLVVADRTRLYRLTPEGYAKYQRRINFLRKFSASGVGN